MTDARNQANSLASMSRSSLHFTLFAAFFLLSLRFVLIYLNYFSGVLWLAGAAAVVGAAAFAAWKPRWTVYGFIISMPLVTGIQVHGVLYPAPIINFGFACIFLGWLVRQVWLRRSFLPCSLPGCLVDLLAGIVFLSILATLGQYPLDFLSIRLLAGSYSGQLDPFWCLDAGYFLLSGLFLFRIIELEGMDDVRHWLNVFLVLAGIVFLFTLVQIVFNQPTPFMRGLHSPFKHLSVYGGYVAFLFFLFLNVLRAGGWRPFWGIPLVTAFFVFLILSLSNAAIFPAIVLLLLFVLLNLGRRLAAGVFLFVALLVVGMNIILHYSWYTPSSRMERRLVQRITPQGFIRGMTARFYYLDQAAGAVAAHPLTGSGIGTYHLIGRHYNLFHEPGAFRPLNVHNYFAQFAAELGVPAFFCFAMILIILYRRLFRAVSEDDDELGVARGLAYGLGVYLLSMLTMEHLLYREQQVLFWSAVAAGCLCFRPMPSETRDNIAAWKPRLLWAVGILVLLGHAHRFVGWGEPVRGFEYGYHNPDSRSGPHSLRWTMHESLTRIEAGSNLLAVTIRAPSPEVIGQTPEVELFVDGEFLERIVFVREGRKQRFYYLAGVQGKSIDVQTRSAGTYNPYRLGLSTDLWQNREQSVEIALDFLRIIPPDGVGFVSAPEWNADDLPQWLRDMPETARWSGGRATLFPDQEQRQNGLSLRLLCGHPDIEDNPVDVDVLANGDVLRTLPCKDHGWQHVNLEPEELAQVKSLTLRVSRTWNTLDAGYAEVDLDLGLVVER